MGALVERLRSANGDRDGVLRDWRKGDKAVRRIGLLCRIVILCVSVFAGSAAGQEKKLEKIRIGGGSTSATQMSMWLAKEGSFYEKHGLSVEAISIPGSSLALQAMLAGELPIIQLGGTASMQANLAARTRSLWRRFSKNFCFPFLAGRKSPGSPILRASSPAPR